MGALPLIMMGVSAAASAGGGIMQSNAEREAGERESDYYKYLAGTSRINASIADAISESEIKDLGAEEQDLIRKLSEKEREAIGSQKTALVTGAGVGSKTGEQIIKDTVSKADLDEMALRYNADMKIRNIRLGNKAQNFNLENQASGYEYAGKNAKLAAKNKSLATILGTAQSTGMNMYSMYKNR